MNLIIKLGILCIFSLSLVSCRTFETPNISVEDEPLHIAVVPGEVARLGRASLDFSAADQRRAELGLGSSLQINIFNNLVDWVTAHHPHSVLVQPFSETNTLLDMKGVAMKELWELPSAELAGILKVDAVLRVSLYQYAGNTTRISGTYENPGAPRDGDGIWTMPGEVEISAGLYEGKSGLPLWTIGQEKPVHLGRKHKVIARRMIRELSAVLP